MVKVFTSAKYLIVIFFVFIFMLFAYADVTTRFFWKSAHKKWLPIALCPSKEDYRTCFNMHDKGSRKCFDTSEQECKEVTAFAIDVCMNQFEKSIPFFIKQPKTQAHWDEVLKDCILEEYENVLEGKRRPIEIRTDKSNTNCIDPET